MKKKKVNLDDFVKGAKFTDNLYRDIFYELVTKHKNESPRQHLIRALIRLYEEKYPNEIRAFQKEMLKTKETRTNEFAADKVQDQRLLFRFPQSLWNRLSLIVTDPPFLSQSNPPTKEEQDEMAWVIKEFPTYVVPEKI